MSNFKGLCTLLSNGTLLYLPACQRPTLTGSRSLPVWAEVETSPQQWQPLLYPVCHLAGLTAGSSQKCRCWLGQTGMCVWGQSSTQDWREWDKATVSHWGGEVLLGCEILLQSRELWQPWAMFHSVFVSTGDETESCLWFEWFWRADVSGNFLVVQWKGKGSRELQTAKQNLGDETSHAVKCRNSRWKSHLTSGTKTPSTHFGG